MSALFAAFGIDIGLLLAQAVNIGIVFVALSYFLYKPLMRTLEERQALIAKGVEDAKRAEEKLAGLDAEVAKCVGDADKEAEAILASARTLASEQKAKTLAEAEARAAQIAADAEARAKETASKAARESEKEVARLAILAAEKILAK